MRDFVSPGTGIASAKDLKVCLNLLVDKWRGRGYSSGVFQIPW